MIKPLAYINVEERKLEWAEPITWQTPTIAKMDKIPLYMRSSDEPAAWFYYRPGETGTFMCGDAEAMKGIEKDGWVTTPLYLHPVKELTDEEIAQVVHELNQKANTPEHWVTAMQIGAETIIQLRDELRKLQEK